MVIKRATKYFDAANTPEFLLSFYFYQTFYYTLFSWRGITKNVLKGGVFENKDFLHILFYERDLKFSFAPKNTHWNIYALLIRGIRTELKFVLADKYRNFIFAGFKAHNTHARCVEDRELLLQPLYHNTTIPPVIPPDVIAHLQATTPNLPFDFPECDLQKELEKVRHDMSKNVLDVPPVNIMRILTHSYKQSLFCVRVLHHEWFHCKKSLYFHKIILIL